MRSICLIGLIVRYLITGNNTEMWVNISIFSCEMEELKERVGLCNC